MFRLGLVFCSDKYQIPPLNISYLGLDEGPSKRIIFNRPEPALLIKLMLSQFCSKLQFDISKDNA